MDSRVGATFDVKSSDTLWLLIFGILASAILGLSASVLGGWIVGQMLSDESPQPVIIVEDRTAEE